MSVIRLTSEFKSESRAEALLKLYPITMHLNYNPRFNLTNYNPNYKTRNVKVTQSRAKRIFYMHASPEQFKPRDFATFTLIAYDTIEYIEAQLKNNLKFNPKTYRTEIINEITEPVYVREYNCMYDVQMNQRNNILHTAKSMRNFITFVIDTCIEHYTGIDEPINYFGRVFLRTNPDTDRQPRSFNNDDNE